LDLGIVRYLVFMFWYFNQSGRQDSPKGMALPEPATSTK